MSVKKYWIKTFSSLNNFGLEKNWDKKIHILKIFGLKEFGSTKIWGKKEFSHKMWVKNWTNVAWPNCHWDSGALLKMVPETYL